MSSDEVSKPAEGSTLQISVDDLKLAHDAYHREREATQPLANALFTDQHRLALEVINFPRLIIPVDRDLIIGRIDNVSGSQPDIDVDPYGGHRMGVSRRHAVLRRITNEIYIADLNSRNGTMINEHRIPPNTLHRLRSEDIIALGTLRIRICFIDIDTLS